MYITQEAKALQSFSEHVWYNPNASIGGNSVFLKNLSSIGNVVMHDLLDANGIIYSFNDIKRDLKAKIYIKEYAGLKKVIQERQALIQAIIRPSL